MNTSQAGELDVVDMNLERCLRDNGMRVGVGDRPGSVADRMCTV
jgi:hypothetical protein